MPIQDYYSYRIFWSDEDNCYIGICLEFPSLSACEDTQEDALREIKSVVNFCVESLKEENKPIPEPIVKKKYSGKLSLRIPEEIHRKITLRATEEGVSLNQYILSKIV